MKKARLLSGPSIDRRGVRHFFRSAADLIPDLSRPSIKKFDKKASPNEISNDMNIIDLISAERLETYRRITVGEKQAIALHNHTLQLGSSMMSMIALLELALRNATNQRLVEHFGDPEWLLPNSSAVPLKSSEIRMVSTAQSHARKALYSKLSYKQKAWLDCFAFPAGMPTGISHKKKAKARQEMFCVSQGQVISQTTIAFWKRLYSSDYESELWKPSLKKVFPNKKL